MRRLSVIALALLAGAGHAPGASATTARVNEECYSNRYQSYCTYDVSITAASGEANTVAVDFEGGELFVTEDTATLHAGPGCDALDDGRVACPRHRATADLGDGDDSLRLVERPCDPGPYPDAQNLCPSLTANGGPGADVLRGSHGWDMLDGGPGPDELHGEDGADTLVDGDADGAVADDLLDGGPGHDRLSYLARKGPVAVDLGSGVGGAQGEADRIESIEDLTTGTGDDLLVGGEAADILDGHSGDDVLRGGGGADALYANQGADRLAGGAGDDVLWPSESSDSRWHAGSPRDHPRDQPDRISCGTGTDRVTYTMPLDLLLVGCEEGTPFGQFSYPRWPVYRPTGEVRRPAGAVVRLVGLHCDERECPMTFRLRLARRAGPARAGTLVGRRRLVLRRGDNANVALRLSPRGRTLLTRAGRLRLRVLETGYGDWGYPTDRRPTGLSLDVRLPGTAPQS